MDRTALVVDDDVFLLSAMAELLSEDGYDVHTASNGFSALRVAVECRPAVILLDLMLPERSGSDVLADLRADQVTRDTAIVVVSGHPEALTEAQLAQTDGLVAKPFDLEELGLAVERALQRAATRRAEVAPVAAFARHNGARSRRSAPARPTHGRR